MPAITQQSGMTLKLVLFINENLFAFMFYENNVTIISLKISIKSFIFQAMHLITNTVTFTDGQNGVPQNKIEMLA